MNSEGFSKALLNTIVILTTLFAGVVLVIVGALTHNELGLTGGLPLVASSVGAGTYQARKSKEGDDSDAE